MEQRTYQVYIIPVTKCTGIAEGDVTRVRTVGHQRRCRYKAQFRTGSRSFPRKRVACIQLDVGSRARSTHVLMICGTTATCYLYLYSCGMRTIYLNETT